ncbi:penicillin-binding protein 1C [Candidatus Roizmanbacteria bacterium]|nr:MAG: penicillin-binding protein 1C [Candidatus Roizmanbacteria bacterium]
MSSEIRLSFRMLKNAILRSIFFLLYVWTVVVVYVGKSVMRAVLFPYTSLRYLTQKVSSLITVKNIGAAGTNSAGAVSYGLKQTGSFLWYVIKNTPLFLISIAKQIIAIIEGIFLGIIHLIASFYSFLTSKYFQYFVYGFLFCLLFLFIQQAYFFVRELPSPAAIGQVNFAQSTHLYDRNGKLLYAIYRDVNRTSVPLSSVPKAVIQATIAIEDKNFYNHKGISFFGGILRAAKDSFIYNELQGGSTITQQLVKTALLTPERTIERKLKEMVLALWTEQMYTKDEIMEMYLNQVPYGGSAYGIEEASKVYFGKTAQELTLGEAALLAGLPRAPSIYSPFIDPDLAERRRDQVLQEMYLQHYISKNQFENAIQEDLTVLPPTTNIRAPHFVMYTRTALENEFGTKKVEESGFNIVTSLDLDIQTKAEEILREEVEKLQPLNASNGGVIVMDPNTGQILAMVGSVNYFGENYGAFNVTTAQRQPGSTLKPMLYAMALENGYTAATPIDDSPIVFNIAGAEPYQPVNYDRRYHGRVPIRYALGNSYNVPAIKVLNTMGVQPFVDFAKTMGIDTWEESSRFGLSIALGGGEVTLVDLTQVYSVFANGGYRVEPTPFVEIKDSREKDVTHIRSTKTRVLNEGVAFIISDILSDNTARQQAFGVNNPLHVKDEIVSAKTGTTNDYKDAWTIGFTDKVVVGVWVGNNNNSSMHSIAGSLGAGPIFNRIMKYMIEEHDAAGKMPQPVNVVSMPCYNGRVEYFLRGTERKSYCQQTVIKQGDKPVQEVRNAVP